MGNTRRATNSRKLDDPQRFEERYTLLDHIGRGGFGAVYTCVETNTANKLAAKLVDNSQVEEWSKSDVENVPMEIKILWSP